MMRETILLNGRRIWLYVAAVILFFSCEKSNESVQDEERPEYVRVSTADTSSFPDEIRVTGNITGWERALITGQSGVTIDQIYADEGDFIKKGATVVKMQESQLNQVRAQLELARKDLRRMKNLLAVGSVSQQQYDQARTEYLTALSNYEQTQENTSLTSPITGVVSEKYFVQGETYVPSADAPAILEIVDLNPVKMEVNVSNQYYTDINRNDNPSINVDNFPDTTFTGSVHKKSPTLNEESRTFGVEIKIMNSDYLLRPGMFATAVFTLADQKGIYVPVSAVIKQEGTTGEYLFLVENRTAVKQSVRTGIRSHGMVQILEGLKKGDVFVIDGAAKLENGDPVVVKDAEE